MSRKFYFIVFILTVFLAYPYSKGVFAAENEAESKSRAEIIDRLQRWTKDFNAKNIKEVCGLFAPNLVASHYGVGDQSYEELCEDLKFAFSSPNKTYFYEAPKIDEVLVKDDLGVVSVIWILKTSFDKGLKTETTTTKSLDIFKRQSDGSWKIVRFLSFDE